MLDPGSSLSCLVNYAGDDVYEVTLYGTTLRFLSREATAVYLTLVVGEASTFDYDLLLARSWAPHYSAVQACCDATVMQRLLLLLRDVRR